MKDPDLRPFMRTFFRYQIAVVLGLAAMAAIVLPDGEHLTWPCFLTGVSMLVLIPLVIDLPMLWWDTRVARRNRS